MSCACVQSSFPPIDPEAKRVLTFNFANGLNDGITIVSAVLEVSCVGGDSTPETHFSTPVVDGANVTTIASGCLDGNTYHLRVIATTSDADTVLALGADLECRNV